jgi:hypothetical protein
MLKLMNLRNFFESTTVDIKEESADNTVIDDINYTLWIAKNRRHECPRLLIKIFDQQIFALVDTDCELSIMNEHL